MDFRHFSALIDSGSSRYIDLLMQPLLFQPIHRENISVEIYGIHAFVYVPAKNQVPIGSHVMRRNTSGTWILSIRTCSGNMATILEILAKYPLPDELICIVNQYINAYVPVNKRINGLDTASETVSETFHASVILHGDMYTRTVKFKIWSIKY